MTEDFWSPVRLSISVAAISLAIVFAAGILLARLLAFKKFKGKPLIETILLLPLVLPPSVVGFLLIIVFGKQSFFGRAIEIFIGQPVIFTWLAAVIASSVVAFPLMYQSAKTGFETIEKEIEDASRVDGASEVKVFLYIALPLSAKALAAGAILSFARALGEFGATLMFAGNIPGKTQTIPTAIYFAIDSGNMEMAWLWTAVMIGISFIMLAAVNAFSK
ncbi:MULTISPECIES: molybdate ABC transporter permease subunit [Bacillus]|uniref:Molybdenum transport system permease n=2 Tax=Bacillus infantis TaxID=324767 RepID=U5LE04_9BACI|nr:MULTISPECIES: molybdate ABC transporter permease subunit [Bacillus]OXT16342.1 molybdenum ABC transporter permease subunit [Bacillus sp. OG2]AGX04931.1 molybdenum ABC transporter permease [Bacillus infantis NRRL B-14911]EAR67976.1 molybdenum transport system (permease) [Bacillus sp. NRRL B-14911]MCK6207441.1 molybdate ABC transporter permease subunit [Bacillus infantis]MCP1159009.1 molybdate ABC transporter permease subunit [Bacillus infantis]